MLSTVKIKGEEYLFAPMRSGSYRSERQLTLDNYFSKEKLQLYDSEKWWRARLAEKYETDGKLCYLPLPEGFLNPFYSFTEWAPLPSLLGIDRRQLHALYTMQLGVIKDKGDSPFREGQALPLEALRAASESQGELSVYREDEFIEKLLLNLNLEKRLGAVLSLLRSGKYFPRAKRADMLRAVNGARLFVALGITPQDLFVREIPVLPPHFMPMTESTLPSGRFFDRGNLQFNVMRRLINRADRFDLNPLSEERIVRDNNTRRSVNMLISGAENFLTDTEAKTGGCFGIFGMLPESKAASPLYLDVLHAMGMDIYPVTAEVREFLRETEPPSVL